MSTLCGWILMICQGLLIAESETVAAQKAPTNNALGQAVVEIYGQLSDKDKAPGGDCHQVCYDRIQSAIKKVCGEDAALPELHTYDSFDRLWVSNPDPRVTWLKLDPQLRGKGPPGALASVGMGTMVGEGALWSGKLEAGAVVQVWKDREDFTRVKSGFPPPNPGRSFLFLGYEKDEKGKILGMRVADEGLLSSKVVARADFGYWVGANLSCK